MTLIGEYASSRFTPALFISTSTPKWSLSTVSARLWMLAASAISNWGYLISIVDEDGFRLKSIPLRDVAYKTRGSWKVLARVWQIASPMPRFYTYIRTTATWLRAQISYRSGHNCNKWVTHVECQSLTGTAKYYKNPRS